MKRLPSDYARQPELLFQEMVQRFVYDGSQRQLYRASVLAVDLIGGVLQNPAGSGEIPVNLRDGKRLTYRALVGPANPRGAVKARVLTDGLDRMLTDDDVRVFWPLFPFDQIGIPVSPGEHVYVMFEGDGTEHGLWLNRVSGHESANGFRGSDSYGGFSQSAMDSFEEEPNGLGDDDHAGQAPQKTAVEAFRDDD